MSAIVSMFDSCVTYQFKLNYLETEKLAIGHPVSSGDVSAGGHLWRIYCYPRGYIKDDDGERCLSIYLCHESKSKEVKAIFEAFVMDKDGTISSSSCKKSVVHVFARKGGGSDSWQGWPCFVKRSVLESLYVTNGTFIIVGAIRVVHDDPLVVVHDDPLDVVHDDPLDVPPSNIGSHLGLLLDSADGSDVSFVVDGKRFPAHRALLAARSPVFKAQLLGSMADAFMPSITLHDIEATTFKLMLCFMYTDAFPADAELGDSPDDVLRLLLAAADRFALDRLKLLCASKLWDNVSVHTVAYTLICAETYNCSGLKKKCLDFFGEEKNFKEAVLTDGFAHLVLKFPSILQELREKVRV